MVEVHGGLPLLYLRKSHSITGHPGRGKSLISLYCGLSVVHASATGRVLFLDLEKDVDEYQERLTAFGLTTDCCEAERVSYWRVDGAIDEIVVAGSVALCRDGHDTLVIIDSVGRAITRAGLDENSNNDVRRWYDACVEPLLRAGATVLLIDHYKKEGGSEQRFSKGAGAKLDVITGAAYGCRVTSPFSQQQSGAAQIMVAKDNNGARAEATIAADVTVTPLGDGRVDITLRAAGGAGQGAIVGWDKRALAVLTEEWMSLNKVRTLAGGSKGYSAATDPLRLALDRLVERGTAEARAGRGHQNAVEYRLAAIEEESE
jgi:hypothetical protein